MGSTMQKPALVTARTTPKGKAIVYWIVTALVCLQMSFTAYAQEQAEAPAGEQQAAKPNLTLFCDNASTCAVLEIIPAACGRSRLLVAARWMCVCANAHL